MQKENIKNKKMSVEDLAIIVQGGFKEMESHFNNRFDDVYKKFDDVDRRFDILEQNISHKIDGLSNRIDDLSINRASREEVKILDMRLTKVEKKLHLQNDK